MLAKFLSVLLLSAAVPATIQAAPVSLKELDLMVRMHTPDAEIVTEISQRRLLSPLDDATAQKLAAEGASASLLAKLKNGKYSLSADASAAEVRRVAERTADAASERARDEAAFVARTNRSGAAPSDQFLRNFEGKLVKMNGGSLSPYPARELSSAKYIGLYYSALWCGPCRQFTPRLVSFYRDMKPRHPEVEIIFVSKDRSAGGMEEYMRKDDMPWPAVRFDQIDANLRAYEADGIPWLVLLDSAGKVVAPRDGFPGGPQGRTWTSPENTVNALQRYMAGGVSIGLVQ